MRTRRAFLLSSLVIAALCLSCSVAWADWNEGDPAKWVQLPDLQNGMDVNATWLWDLGKVPPTGGPPLPTFPFQKTLADDFLCVMRGPITDIHIWGSWLNDAVNDATRFRLALYSDVPAVPGALYSHPGEVLWERYFAPGEYRARLYAEAQELFFEPNTNEIIGSDTQVWQYNFLIDPADAFIQLGEPNAPVVYWLGVEAIVPWDSREPNDIQEIFGWKTSLQHWNDDAVFGDSDSPFVHPGPSEWRELFDPRTGVSLDMSFAITTIPEPSTWVLATLAMLGGAFIARRYRARGAA